MHDTVFEITSRILLDQFKIVLNANNAMDSVPPISFMCTYECVCFKTSCFFDGRDFFFSQF